MKSQNTYWVGTVNFVAKSVMDPPNSDEAGPLLDALVDLGETQIGFRDRYPRESSEGTFHLIA